MRGAVREIGLRHTVVVTDDGVPALVQPVNDDSKPPFTTPGTAVLMTAVWVRPPALPVTVTPVAVGISLGGLTQAYTGQGLGPVATTTVPDVALRLTYNGSATRPVEPGTYTVVAVPADGSYSGTATALFTIQRASQFVTLAPIDLRVPLRFADSPVAVKATASSGLPVTLSVAAVMLAVAVPEVQPVST